MQSLWQNDVKGRSVWLLCDIGWGDLDSCVWTVQLAATSLYRAKSDSSLPSLQHSTVSLVTASIISMSIPHTICVDCLAVYISAVFNWTQTLRFIYTGRTSTTRFYCLSVLILSNAHRRIHKCIFINKLLSPEKYFPIHTKFLVLNDWNGNPQVCAFKSICKFHQKPIWMFLHLYTNCLSWMNYLWQKYIRKGRQGLD